VFTHIAEKLHLFPGVGWGLPDSPGHYLDLSPPPPAFLREWLRGTWPTR
jgi:hypothetical protein